MEAEIGRGGQAVVYRATQLDLDRPVALKVFDEGYLTRGGALERFRREAIAAGRMEHPRIVPVYDAGEIDGRAFMSMRFVAGDSLAERIARGGPLEPAQALAMLSDIGDALDFAHARETVHRDVKPANILLDPDGTSYLGDFGLVRLDDMPGLTRRGDWLGTAEYVSPEQVEGEPATARSDLYGLAAVAFEALTGRAPFVRREPSAVLLAHVREPVPDASAINAGLPVAVDEVLARGLAKDPEDRFPSAHAFVGELRHALASSELRPTVVGAAAVAGAAAGDPWDAALSRFSETGGGPVGDRPTQAFGDAALRRRRFTWGRETAVAAAVAGVLLLTGAALGGWALGSSSADASGAEARGYDAGQTAGLTQGKKQGRAVGFVAGKQEGTKVGKTQGRAVGFAAGKKEGVEQGRQEGYSTGVSEGRSSALSGLSPGGWYIVRVGSDESGAVVSQSQAVPTDASTCFAVSGGTVLSGSC